MYIYIYLHIYIYTSSSDPSHESSSELLSLLSALFFFFFSPPRAAGARGFAPRPRAAVFPGLTESATHPRLVGFPGRPFGVGGMSRCLARHPDDAPPPSAPFVWALACGCDNSWDQIWNRIEPEL